MITSMNINAVKTICLWKYPEPYNIYNYMSFEEAIKNNSPLLNDKNSNNYVCFWENETLTAYISIIRKDNRIFLGIGVSPDYCGNGLGKIYLKQGVEIAEKRYPDSEIWIQVRVWNERAIKCYEKCNFKKQYKKTVIDRFGNEEEFIFMRKEKQ